MNHYQIKFAGLTYHVEPFFDDGELFAVIHRVDGLEQYGPDDLPGLFDDDAHVRLSSLLVEALMEANDEY